MASADKQRAAVAALVGVSEVVSSTSRTEQLKQEKKKLREDQKKLRQQEKDLKKVIKKQKASASKLSKEHLIDVLVQKCVAEAAAN